MSAHLPTKRTNNALLPNRKMRHFEHWKLEDAKARLSEVVRKAKQEGPQVVTVRGEEAVVVLSAEEFAGMLPASKRSDSLVEFLESLPLADIALKRERDTGRDIEF